MKKNQDRNGDDRPRVAVIIPCFRVRDSILDVVRGIGPEVSHVIVVDDFCPEDSGSHVTANCDDERLTVLRHMVNLGVGAATITGYRHALSLGVDVIVKIDGDGQMDPGLIPQFIGPILRREADYAKGNRFYNIDDAKAMPLARLVGNAGLSFLTKLSSGYWSIFDPTNGYTAISAAVAAHLPFEKVSQRFFFESDMLFRLGIMRAYVLDIPMRAVYGKERSNLRICRVLLPFLFANLRNLFKRIFYNYFLRDFSIASLQLGFGSVSTFVGGVYGVDAWIRSSMSGIVATTGQVMLAALPIMLGIQLLLSFLAYDMAMTPVRPIQTLLRNAR